jgi:hypothetical protein
MLPKEKKKEKTKLLPTGVSKYTPHTVYYKYYLYETTR